jgi:uncharacterized protein (DUF697 family)
MAPVAKHAEADAVEHEETAPSTPLTDAERAARRVGAEKIVLDFSYWAGGFGLIPLPVVDFAAVTVMQVRMTAALAKHYNDPFSKERARAIIMSLVGSALPVAAGAGAGSLLKALPVFGQVLGVIAVPTFAWASTRALGAVFIEHFESGGTLLNLDIEKTRHYFMQEFELARKHEPAAKTDKKGQALPST